jgi:hypothetical protein
MINSDAIFSEDRKHRYALFREWDLSKPSLMFIGLNPSTADEKADDPTIRRCIGFAKRWGFGKLIVANLFSFRTPSPKELFRSENPVRKENDYWLERLSREAQKVILAYGNQGKFKNRHGEILKIIESPYCIQKSKTGMPMHPLYLRYTKEPVKF